MTRRAGTRRLRRVISCAVLGVMMAGARPCGAQEHVPVPAEGEAPNVIVFLADDMGIGDTSAYLDWTGNDPSEQLHTPAMETLARAGVRFTDAHSPHSRCSTTRYALLTGRYCWRTRLKHWVLFGVQCDPLLEQDRLTLPEFLREAGYRTGMVGKWHLGLTYRRTDGTPADGWEDADLTRPIADGPLDHGFDFFYGISRSHGTSGPNGMRRHAPDQSIGPGWIHNRDVVGATGEGKRLTGGYVLNEIGPELDRHAREFLRDAVDREVPFFLYFASPSNHLPHTPCRRVGDMPVAGASRFVDGRATGDARLDYVYENDVLLARLMQFLRETDDPRRPGRPLLENTLIVFSSDNGAENAAPRFTGPLRSNKGSLFEGGHRVPFIASWPAGGIGGDGQTAGRVCERLLALNDVYATMAEILARPLPPVRGQGRGAEDSVSQLAAMRGLPWESRPPVFPNDHKQAFERRDDRRAWVAVRSNNAPLEGQWKLLLDHRYAFDQQIHPQALYNLADDLREQHNRLDDPELQPVVEYLVEQARRAAGDDGSSR